MKFLTAALLFFALSGCASNPAPDRSTASTAESEEVELEPLGGSKVCGWSDTGRWVCEERGKKKSRGKFTTKFKKKPAARQPSEHDPKLPRGDQPTVLEPIDESDPAAKTPGDGF